MYRRSYSIPLWPVVVVIFIIAAISVNSIPDSRAIKAMDDAGYTDIQIVDSTVWFVEVRGCGSDDLKQWTVKGKNIRGEERTLIVCGGFFKGTTIRSR